MLSKPHAKVFALTAITLALSACNSSDGSENNNQETSKGVVYTNPGIPKGVTETEIIAEPDIDGTSVIDGNIPVTNFKGNVIAYNEDVNPILQILSGFNDIWFHGDETWASTGSSTNTVAEGFETYTGTSGGASNSTSRALLLKFDGATTLNEAVWHYNFDYVASMTRPGESQPDVDRNDAASQVFAYLDDQREKGYSITSGLGALAEDYRTGAHSISSYSYSSDGTKVYVDGKEVDIFNENKLMDDGLGQGTNYGELGYELDSVVKLLNLIRDFGASTEAPKYHFDSPRPWRIESDYSVASFADIANVSKLTCYKLDNTSEVKYYDFPIEPLVSPIAGLRCAGRQIYKDNQDGSFSQPYEEGSLWVSGRAKDGGFPSGHTTEAVDRGLALAYAIPERFTEMAVRAVDLGTNRIVAGMHSPLDVIGGRIMGTAVTAAALNAEPNIAASAVQEARDYFLEKAEKKGFDSVYDYAQSPVMDIEAVRYSDRKKMKERYREALTYGFEPLDEPSLAPEVPKGAEVLLASRFPYLTNMQRRTVLATTEINSNYPVINKSRGWGRLNLVDAADGYAEFYGNIDVNMDASDGGFNAEDYWRNDISGEGRLTKNGTGTLYLTGNNTYSGGTLVQGGSLIATSPTAFGTNTLYVTDGNVEISTKEALTVSDFVMEGGELTIDLVTNENAQLKAENGIYLTGADQVLHLHVPIVNIPVSYTVLTANHLEGEFKEINAVDVEGNTYIVAMNYAENGAVVTVSPSS